MSERAYSCELHKNISAKKAVELSEKGCLTDERAFRCCDQKCKIRLTCTNWKHKDGKRFYFVPSHNDELHVIGCDEVGAKEARLQIEKEIRDITNEVKSNGIITMIISPDRNTKEMEGAHDPKIIASIGNEYLYKRESEYYGIKCEGRRAARMESFVELYNGENIDKDKNVICIKGEMFSLNKLFVSSNKNLDDGTFGIFYGESLIKTCKFNPNMIEITYLNSSFPQIYTNVDSLKKITNGRKVRECIDTNKIVITYFRGTYHQEKNKFESYNDRYFKDLYFEI